MQLFRLHGPINALAFTSRFRLTTALISHFFRRLRTNYSLLFDMKKMFVLSMLISLAMICSCQKQDSTVEAQLAQRKVELDSREQALDEREKALEQREEAAADREKAITK